MSTNESKWMRNWPVRGGLYWFYGFPDGYIQGKPQLLLIEVNETSDKAYHSQKLDSYIEIGVGIGIWQKVAIIPDRHLLRELVESHMDEW